ncbi:MAG: hypothetical protein HWE27_00685 [Gammaproteobacteria bacterium]|nr:hypothetical protein [Gammaproteobacteria bacterium]
MKLNKSMRHCRSILSAFGLLSIFATTVNAANQPSENNKSDSTAAVTRELKVIQSGYLSSDDVRFYSNLVWQQQPGSALSVHLLPSVNASEHDVYQVSFDNQNVGDLESKSVPSTLQAVNQELVNNTRFLKAVNHSAEFQLQFIIQNYETLYSLTGSDNWLDYSFAKLDQAWSAMAGDNKPSRVNVTAVLYNKSGEMLLQVASGGSLSPCERSANPMIFPPHHGQAFLNGFAKTTTGQTYIAAVNRTLTEVAKYLANEPIRGEVLKVDRNNIYLSIGEGIVYPNETVNLIYSNNDNFPSYTLGRLEIEAVEQSISVAHAIDMHTANVIPGDKVQLKKVIQERAYLSAGERSVTCS